MATYLLMIHFPVSGTIRVGALGEQTLAAGEYLYVGSAKRHWQARIKRHLGTTTRRHWHIDYLLAIPQAQVTSVWVTLADQECQTARMLLELDKIAVVKPGMGASDCRCQGHFLRAGGKIESIEEKLDGMGFFQHI
ncbi:MAG: GIY-YIG nuclease family protein [Magnetococcales bacterium]|nr:GIY-YIG nuclease family protein [Magnetococcales bacterium]